jgi:uncharacterized protein
MPKMLRLQEIIRQLCAFGLICCFACASNTATAKGQLAIIIDDIGYNRVLGLRTADLPETITLAVLPFTPHARELAERAHQQGKEIMLHAPMSNRHQYPLGPGALVSGMHKTEFLQVLRENIANIPHLKGVNNHMGSQLTEQAEPMSWLMEELKDRQLYFIDSRTSAQTQALKMAEQIHLPSLKRDVFLDDERSSSAIQRELVRALKLANKQGSAIAIGHPYRETLTQLEQIHPLLDQYQVQLVKVSQLMPANQLLPKAKNIPQNATCIAPPLNLWPTTWVPIDPFMLELDLKL